MPKSDVVLGCSNARCRTQWQSNVPATRHKKAGFRDIQITRHKTLLKEASQHAEDCSREVKESEKYSNYRHKFFDMLVEFQSIWNGHSGAKMIQNIVSRSWASIQNLPSRRHTESKVAYKCRNLWGDRTKCHSISLRRTSSFRCIRPQEKRYSSLLCQLQEIIRFKK